MIRRLNILRGERLLNRLIGYCDVSVLCSSFGRAGRTVPCRAPVVAGGRGAAFHNTSRGRTVRRRGGEGASVAGDRVVGTQTPCVTPARQASAVAGVAPLHVYASSLLHGAFRLRAGRSGPSWRLRSGGRRSRPTPAPPASACFGRARTCPLRLPQARRRAASAGASLRGPSAAARLKPQARPSAHRLQLREV